MKQLHIADGLSLPLDFVTERIAFLARTGAGKSGGMRVLFEEFLEAKQFVVFLDPKGDAWGIRAAGVGAGYPVLVMGGDHGDVPLESSAGKVVAEFLVKERVSTVLDVSDFGKAGMIKFVTDLATTLYRRNRDVLQFMLDEADMVAGEKFYDPHCLEAIQLIQNKGRHRGFGVTVASQRSAMINKTVLYASGTLVAMQTTSPKDIKTIRDWLEVVATAEAAKEIVSALPTLRTREALVYSPQYLGSQPQRITFKTFRTFDSMRTPRPGETRQQPKSLADIDLSTVQKDMAATIEKFKAEDPRELRKQIAELKKQTAKPEVIVRPAETIKEIEKPILKDAQIKRLESVGEKLSTVGTQLVEVAREITAALGKYSGNGNSHKPAPTPSQIPRTLPTRTVQPKPRAISEYSGSLPIGEQKILAALIQYPNGLERNQLTVLTGYKRSTRDAYIQRLGEKGFVRTSGKVFATDEGIAALPDHEPLPTGTALIDYWHGKLPEGEWKILEQLIIAYPEAVDRELLTDHTGYKRSTRDAYVQRLASKELVDPGRGSVTASENLFLE